MASEIEAALANEAGENMLMAIEIRVIRTRLTALEAALKAALAENAVWREAEETHHDQDYGHCRRSCSRCELARKAWTLSHETDAKTKECGL